MKKSQILAALALAFSLGVVAPVAGLYAENSAYAATESMSAADLNAAISKVKGQSAYKLYKALNDAINNKKYVDPTTKVSDIETAIKGVAGAAYSAPANATLAEIIEIATGAEKQDDKTIINANVYAAYAKLYADINTDGVKADTIRADVVAINNLLPEADRFDMDTVKDKTLANEVINAVTDATNGLTNYGEYKALIEKVNAAETEAQNAADGIKALKAAYTALYNAGYAKPKDSAQKYIADLNDAKTIDDLKAKTNTINRWDEWTNTTDGLIAVVENAKATNISATNGATYDKINVALAKAYGVADLTVADLPAGTPTPENPDNKPEDGDKPGDNNGDDQKDPSAPGTGVLSSADGNAATTVSIVAGLATALTALGAGVVAYRSARRSNK